VPKLKIESLVRQLMVDYSNFQNKILSLKNLGYDFFFLLSTYCYLAFFNLQDVTWQ